MNILRMQNAYRRTLLVDDESFLRTSKTVMKAIPTGNISWIENCIAFHYVTVLAKDVGISTVLTANGIDELFCGYDAYRRMEDQSEVAILSAMDAKIKNELSMMQKISEIIQDTKVQIMQPLLAEEFITYARNLPLYGKIRAFRSSDCYASMHIMGPCIQSIGVPETFLHHVRKNAHHLQCFAMFISNYDLWRCKFHICLSISMCIR